jgi:glycosyltransferase involved in cell wall biosynthesis
LTEALTKLWHINGDFLSLKPTGVARYGHEVAQALDALVAEGHPLTQSVRFEVISPVQPAAGFFRSIPVRVVPPLPVHIPQFWVQVQLPWAAADRLLSFGNLGPVAARRQILCVHDLHSITMPESFSRGFRYAHSLLTPLLGKRARLMTVSEFSKAEIVRLGFSRPENITVTYNGSEHALRWNPALSHSLPELPKPFVLGIGRDLPYKNTGLMVGMAEALDALGLDLVLAGSFDVSRYDGWQAGNIRVVGRVSDDDLASLLDRALCFLFPSRMEGFGLPMAEAMARGCPVLASRAGSLAEIGRTGAILLDPDDRDAWVDATASLLHDPAARQALAAAGRRRAEDFSWRRIAVQYLEAMADIDGHRPA